MRNRTIQRPDNNGAEYVGEDNPRAEFVPHPDFIATRVPRSRPEGRDTSVRSFIRAARQRHDPRMRGHVHVHRRNE